LVLLGFVPWVVFVSRRTLSGLGPVRKWVAVSLRAVIVALLAMALAEPRIRRPSENVTVLFAVDRSYSVPQDVDPDAKADDAVDRRWARVRGFIESAVKQHGLDHRDDPAGLILFGRRPRLALPPAPVLSMPMDERMAGPIDGNSTDIAAALKLALASFPEGTAKRIVLFSDGNENIGAAEEQANIAKQTGVQIDTVALAPGFRNQSEVLVQAVEAPPTSSVGQRLPVRVLIRNANPDRVVDGRLDLLKVGREGDSPVPIEDGPQVLEPKTPALVRLLPGLNVFRFRDRADPQGDSAFSYRATFTPTRTAGLKGERPVAGLPGDRPANNRATAAVVSRGQRRVLFLDEGATRATSPHRHLLDALDRAKIRVDHLAVGKLPADKADLGIFLTNYDEVVIGNVPYEAFSGDQAEAIRAAVYDQGCGLVMIGGPAAFGPGGYQGSPIEAALPVDCEIKAMKAAGRGGLVLIMHASEMADGNKWQKDIAKLAIQRLGPNDMVGITQYGFGGNGVSWHVPFQEVGDDKRRFFAQLDLMTPGDMPDFDPFLVAAADELSNPKHNLAVKHCILISDGDPQYSSPGVGATAVAKMAENAITCTTVGVATHGGTEKTRLQSIASGTKDGAGKPGTF
ncbi:MAG: VWA domain-containing protein, partial [Fimbriiglobus sp.]